MLRTEDTVNTVVHLSPYVYIIKTYGFRTSIYLGSETDHYIVLAVVLLLESGLQD